METQLYSHLGQEPVDARVEQHEGVEGAALAAPAEAGRPLRHGAGGHAVPGAHLANKMHKDGEEQWLV